VTVRYVLVFAPDLFFATRIEATARALGVRLEAAAATDLLAVARREPPDLILLDLHAPGDPVALGRALKQDPLVAGIPIVGFYSHVDRDLRERALAAGIEHVLPRSAFTRRLPDLLSGDGDTTD
jgi:CheY-like chemotaxis protein